MIREITALLEEHRRLTLGEIAAALGSQWEAVKPLMDLLARKGRVRLISCSRGSCSGCSCASREKTLIYELTSQGPA